MQFIEAKLNKITTLQISIAVPLSTRAEQSLWVWVGVGEGGWEIRGAALDQ